MTDERNSAARDLGIGLVGYAFMGKAHSHAWRTAPSFFDLPLAPRLKVLAGRNADAARAVAEKFGWEHVETEWRALVARDDVEDHGEPEPVRGERERLADAQASAPEHDDQPAQPATVDTVAGVTHHGDDLLDRRRVGGVAHPLVARRPPGVELRQRGR